MVLVHLLFPYSPLPTQPQVLSTLPLKSLWFLLPATPAFLARAAIISPSTASTLIPYIHLYPHKPISFLAALHAAAPLYSTTGSGRGLPAPSRLREHPVVPHCLAAGSLHVFPTSLYTPHHDTAVQGHVSYCAINSSYRVWHWQHVGRGGEAIFEMDRARR